MGNIFNKPFTFNKSNNDYKDYCLKFDRILDTDNQVYIGIGKKDQVIRFGDYKNKYHRLMLCTEYKNKLQYEFENNVTMTLEKIENNIQLGVVDLRNKKVIIKNIDPIIVKMYKPISLLPLSEDLDKIHELFVSSKEVVLAEDEYRSNEI